MARPERFEGPPLRFVVCFFRSETIAYLVSNGLHGQLALRTTYAG